MYLKIKVKPDSRKEKVEMKSEDTFFVSTKEPAEEGRANERVLEIIREMYPNRSVRLVSGHQKPSKIVEVV